MQGLRRLLSYLLATLPHGWAFGEEGGEALVFVGSSGEAAEDFGFGFESLGEGLAGAAVDGFEDAGDGERRHGGDGLGDGLGAGEEVCGGDDVVDEAEAEGFGGVDDLGREHHAEGGAGADEAREALGAAIAGDEAEFDFGKTETGFVTGDAESAGEGEFAAAAEGDAVDGGDDGLAGALEEGFDEGEDVLAALGDGEAGEGVGVGKGANVGAGGEGTIARAGDDDGAEGGVGGEGGEDELELVEHAGVEGVEDFGAVEGDGRDGAGEVVVQGVEVGHRVRDPIKMYAGRWRSRQVRFG
jgi:hypothetical protein